MKGKGSYLVRPARIQRSYLQQSQLQKQTQEGRKLKARARSNPSLSEELPGSRMTPGHMKAARVRYAFAETLCSPSYTCMSQHGCRLGSQLTACEKPTWEAKLTRSHSQNYQTVSLRWGTAQYVKVSENNTTRREELSKGSALGSPGQGPDLASHLQLQAVPCPFLWWSWIKRISQRR